MDSVRNAFIEELKQISALHNEKYLTNLLVEHQQESKKKEMAEISKQDKVALGILVGVLGVLIIGLIMLFCVL